REHLAESIAHRRAAVQSALDAASERHRKNVQLEAPIEDRLSGFPIDHDEALPTIKRAPPTLVADSTGSSKPFVVSAQAGGPSVPPQRDGLPAGVPKRGRLRVMAIGASAAILVALAVFVARARIVGSYALRPRPSAVASPAPSDEPPAPPDSADPPPV